MTGRGGSRGARRYLGAALPSGASEGRRDIVTVQRAVAGRNSSATRRAGTSLPVILPDLPFRPERRGGRGCGHSWRTAGWRRARNHYLPARGSVALGVAERVTGRDAWAFAGRCRSFTLRHRPASRAVRACSAVRERIFTPSLRQAYSDPGPGAARNLGPWLRVEPWRGVLSRQTASGSRAPPRDGADPDLRPAAGRVAGGHRPAAGCPVAAGRHGTRHRPGARWSGAHRRSRPVRWPRPARGGARLAAAGRGDGPGQARGTGRTRRTGQGCGTAPVCGTAPICGTGRSCGACAARRAGPGGGDAPARGAGPGRGAGADGTGGADGPGARRAASGDLHAPAVRRP